MFSDSYYWKGKCFRSPGLHSYLRPSANLKRSHPPRSGAPWLTAGPTTPYHLPPNPRIHLSCPRGLCWHWVCNSRYVSTVVFHQWENRKFRASSDMPEVGDLWINGRVKSPEPQPGIIVMILGHLCFLGNPFWQGPLLRTSWQDVLQKFGLTRETTGWGRGEAFKAYTAWGRTADKNKYCGPTRRAAMGWCSD